MNIKLSKKTLMVIGVIVFILIYFLLNGLGNMIYAVMDSIKNTKNLLKPAPINIQFSTFFGFYFKSFLFYGIYTLIAGIFSGIVLYKLRSNFSVLEKGEKGTSRFTTLKELKKQYKAVPEKEDRFEGGGGVPVSRYNALSLKKLRETLTQAKANFPWSEDFLWKSVNETLKKISWKQGYIFIDDSPVNNLWVGTTRSGKGEIGMFSMLDVYSRAMNQASLIVNDPKGELFAASKKTLEQRGYLVEVLNLSDPMQSMSYQLLQFVIDNYKQGNVSAAQQYAHSISFMLYNDPNSKDPFWNNSSISLCNALILAICDECIKKNKEHQITMYSVANMLTNLGGTNYLNMLTGKEINALDLYFSDLPEDNAAKMQYATSNFATGTARGGIFSNTMSKLAIFTQDDVAKMTSMNSFDLKKVGFGQTVLGYAADLTRVNMLFPNGTVETIKTVTISL